jgi:DNA-binding LacI/PurR family transcriptional regulator/biotin operon repressor
MPGLTVLSASEQVAAYLEGELRRGAWTGQMPGGDRLAADLRVGRDTVEAALRQLENEGLLVNQGRRRGRRIEPSACDPAARRIRVGVLLGEPADLRIDYIVEFQHALAKAGHAVVVAPKDMLDLGMELPRIARMVTNTKADAWVVVAGSKDVLEWFAGRPEPAFALFGRRRGLPLAGVGPDKPRAYATATRELIGLGHRRIVMLARPRRRLPEPGASERAFLDELATGGVAPGPYHLPDWEESIEGFRMCLESLFRLTPPTALLVDEAPFFVATQQFLARRGVRVPEDVSLVCTDADPAFEWCWPAVAHVRWDSRPVVRRILNWASNVGLGKEDKRQTVTAAEFVSGGTIGPAKD